MCFTSQNKSVMPVSELKTELDSASIWRGPTILEIARESGVASATVDRVVNGRGNVRSGNKARVLAAIERLKQSVKPQAATAPKRITFISDSGVSFNQTLEVAIFEYAKLHPEVECSFTGIPTTKVDAIKLATEIERAALNADALVVVARENLMVNRAVRNVVAQKIPVICLTTDLPTTGRHAFVGSDPTAAGSTAAFLMGQIIGNRDGNVLLVYSAPYRVQEERELGFRRVLRAEFPRLSVDERVNSNDDTDFVYRNVVRYIEEHGAPAGIYNVAAGNIGISKALAEYDLVGKTVFIGHELNPNSRHLLESGVMNLVIGHDVLVEVETAIRHCLALLETPMLTQPALTRVRVYTKYSCN
jgi:LacI family transcriptional regulator